MTAQQNEDRKMPQNVPTSNDHSTKPTAPAERDEEHTYDPVGMAGKKAGKVQEIEHQLRREDAVDREQPAPDNGRPGKEQ